MEDQERLRSIYARMFADCFAEIKIVDNRESLIDAYVDKMDLSGCSYDIVILDMEIYGDFTCGIKTLYDLEKIDPHVCAILCSSSSHAAMEKPQIYGFKASVEKPFEKADFVKVIKRALDC